MTPEQDERLIVALENISNTLLFMAQPAEPEQPPFECAHPFEDRIDFGTTNGIQDFQCRLCSFRSVG